MQLFHFEQQIVFNSCFEIFNKPCKLFVVDWHHLDLNFVFSHNVESQKNCFLVHVSDLISDQLHNVVIGKKVLYVLLTVSFLALICLRSLLDVYLSFEVTTFVALMLLAEEFLQETWHLLSAQIICRKKFENVVRNVLVVLNVEHFNELFVEKNQLSIL